MKSTLSVSILALIVIQLSAQELKLKLSDVFPRAGENIMVGYELIDTSKQVFKLVEESPNKAPVISCKTPDNIILNGTCEFKKEYINDNKITVGPFIYIFNGKQYSSDSIHIAISPQLPNVRSGFWVKHIKFHDSPYIVIEQRIEKKFTGNPQSLQSHEYGGDFVEIDREKFKSDERAIISWTTKSGTSYIEGDSPKADRKFSYKKWIYKVWLSDTYKGDFILTKDYFKNYPDSLNYKPIMLK